ncbi:hypothetical protein [Streptomyces yerevanensis]|uniref:hypothetical protein n=1 Tax=Streptomyces yerevanensis TaxID=66378 RepID=UPI000524358C|nr:hypothetical protein [Streptomyces yerevanensis]
MKVRKALTAAGATAAMAAGLVLAGPVTQAQAASTLACAQVSGNPAGACIYNIEFRRYRVTVWDNKCDGHRVYAEYRFNPLGNRKFAPATACGNSYSYSFSNDFNAPYGGSIRVCIEDWGPNTCSGWKEW